MSSTLLHRDHDLGWAAGVDDLPDSLPETGSSGRARTQWLVLAAALTVLAGTLVAWGLGRAAARSEVVSLAGPVAAGTPFTAADLTVSSVAVDGSVQGLVPAGSLDRLIGRVAVIDLEPGTLLSVGMWSDGTQVLPGERTVGAVLDAGRFPTGLAPADQALAVALDGAAPAPIDERAGTGGDRAPGGDITVRVLEARTDDMGRLYVTLAAPSPVAVDLARLAATEALVLVGLPLEVAAP